MTTLWSDQYESSSDDDEFEQIPPKLLRERNKWMQVYESEVEEMFEAYMKLGRCLFGPSFHQLGTLGDYARFVFKHTQPGGK